LATRLSAAWKNNPSAFDRSAQGWYPTHEDEVITIEGFNLYSSANAATVHVRPASDSAYNAAGVVPLQTTSGSGSVGTHSVNRVYARVDNNNVVRVGTVDSINNNNSSADYNSEANVSNNLNLNDNRAIYVWNTGFLYSMNPAYVYKPFMRMADDGTRLLAYGYFNGSQSGRVRVARNNKTIDSAQAFSNRMLNNTIATGGSNNSWYTMGSDQSSSSNRGLVLGRSSADGEYNGIGSNLIQIVNQNTNNARRYAISFITGMENSNSDRYEIPRIAVRPATAGADRGDNNVDRVFIS